MEAEEAPGAEAVRRRVAPRGRGGRLVTGQDVEELELGGDVVGAVPVPVAGGGGEAEVVVEAQDVLHHLQAAAAVLGLVGEAGCAERAAELEAGEVVGLHGGEIRGGAERGRVDGPRRGGEGGSEVAGVGAVGDGGVQLR